MSQQIDAVCQMNCLRHVKIYKLKQLGLSNKEIADALGTNAGHVYNALKDYEAKPSKKDRAESVK